MRDNITLACTVCGAENYTTTKNKKKQPNRVEYLKFCPKCNKKTIHKEKK
jgi:large subunit ribosomal protein L33